jgi:hypothetical protein
MGGTARFRPPRFGRGKDKERPMDLKIYYQKIRECETKILEDFPVVVSKETGDGGKAGTLTEVPKALAAKLIVDGIAALATDEELQTFRSMIAAAKADADRRAAAVAAMQLTLVPKQELEHLRSNQTTAKK